MSLDKLSTHAISVPRLKPRPSIQPKPIGTNAKCIPQYARASTSPNEGRWQQRPLLARDIGAEIKSELFCTASRSPFPRSRSSPNRSCAPWWQSSSKFGHLWPLPFLCIEMTHYNQGPVQPGDGLLYAGTLWLQQMQPHMSNERSESGS